MSKNFTLFAVLTAVLLFLLFLDIRIGTVNISLNEISDFLRGKEIDKTRFVILSEFRIPKSLTALIAGFALSIAGLQMQTFFGNPLAGPYILGISSGASLGVALLLLSPLPLFIQDYFNPFWLTGIVAGIGASGILLLIFAVSIRIKDIMTILIIGILTGSAANSVVNVLQYFGNRAELKTFVVWTMGSFSGVTGEQLNILAIFVLTGFIISLLSIKHLNLLLLGENYAQTSGMNIKLTGAVVFLSTGIFAGSVTAFCGPIGFVGIISPHIAKTLFKTANHKTLLPAAAITGAIITLASDIISGLPGIQGTLPVNSVTSIIGIPFIIYLIIKNKI